MQARQHSLLENMDQLDEEEEESEATEKTETKHVYKVYTYIHTLKQTNIYTSIRSTKYLTEHFYYYRVMTNSGMASM